MAVSYSRHIPKEIDMQIEKLARHLGFAVGAIAALGVLIYSIEYEPLFSALAH